MVAMVLQNRQDSSLFEESFVDEALKSPQEGGYIITRRRYTRGPLRRFKTGFSDLSNTEKDSLMTFYQTHTTVVIFQWTHPVSAVQYDVRFENPIAPRYIGAGAFRFWQVTDISLVEA